MLLRRLHELRVDKLAHSLESGLEGVNEQMLLLDLVHQVVRIPAMLKAFYRALALLLSHLRDQFCQSLKLRRLQLNVSCIHFVQRR